MTSTSWHENLVNVIRGVIFQDDKLKELMMIPEAERKNIVSFRDKYFINEVLGDELLDNIPVRILYHLDEPYDIGGMNVRQDELFIDIYVERKHAYDYGVDRMLHRGHLIAERLEHLLCRGKKHYNLSFRCRQIADLTSKREGYDRVTAIMVYKHIYK